MMTKLFLLLIVLLLGGCRADFSEVLPTEEKPVYIRFASDASINASVSESTRSGSIVGDTLSVGILGLGVQESELSTATLAGRNHWSFRDWMSNDLYYYVRGDGNGIVHSQGEIPSFPLEENSAVAAYAYLPRIDMERIVCDMYSCYIPLDLVADEAATDWMFSGKVARSKNDARAQHDSIFTFKFKHAMARLDFVISPDNLAAGEELKLLEIDLGVYSHGLGLLSLEDGEVILDRTTLYPDSVYRLRRSIGDIVFSDALTTHTETLYLIPQTEIYDFRVLALWHGKDTVLCERMMNPYKWNYKNMTAGTRSVITVQSFEEKKNVK